MNAGDTIVFWVGGIAMSDAPIAGVRDRTSMLELALFKQGEMRITIGVVVQ